MDALKIAEGIIADGRIILQGNWHEMKLELMHEFTEMGISEEEKKKALRLVRAAWY